MCTDTYGVRTDFHVPSFREGSEECFEFKGGYDFERFMFDFDSSGSQIDPGYKYKSFNTELRKAINIARANGLTYKGLTIKGIKPFCVYLFEEIKGLLPIKDRKKLRMYITLGTALDLIHGVDMVICMSERFVTIDTTIDPFGKDRNRPIFGHGHHLIFSHYNISQRETNKFAKKVVEILTTKGD